MVRDNLHYTVLEILVKFRYHEIVIDFSPFDQAQIIVNISHRGQLATPTKDIKSVSVSDLLFSLDMPLILVNFS